MIYNGAEIIFTRYRDGRSLVRYDATLLSGEWPDDDALITLADGGNPETGGCHFGGYVTKTGPRTAEVGVYID